MFSVKAWGEWIVGRGDEVYANAVDGGYEGGEAFYQAVGVRVYDALGITSLLIAITGEDPISLQKYTNSERLFHGILGTVQLMTVILNGAATLSLMRGGCGFVCFVSGTPVVVGSQVKAATSSLTVMAGGSKGHEHQIALGTGCLLVGLGGGLLLVLPNDRRRRRGTKLEAAVDFGVDNEDDEPWWNPDPRREPAMPELTPAEFEQLCDRLFAGPEASDWSAEQESEATSSMRVTGLKNAVSLAPIDRALNAAKPVALAAPTIGRGAVAVSSARRRAQKLKTPERSSRSWTSGLRWTWVVLFTLVGGGLVFDGWRGERVTQATQASPPSVILETRSIEQIRLGDRIAGRNPLREQAETIEPDPATWRRISLEMRKPSGARVWIELLRPLEWLEAVGARPGHSIELELHELGAVGPAQVTAIGPCPEIQLGSGTIVTGTFKHEADAGNRVVHLRLEGQLEPTGVTDTHPYWSVDRQEFVEVGELGIGEVVDTIFGHKRVTSITPIEHDGILCNLEASEHVYRVGTLGELVHNSCTSTFDLPTNWRSPKGVSGKLTDGDYSFRIDTHNLSQGERSHVHILDRLGKEVAVIQGRGTNGIWRASHRGRKLLRPSEASSQLRTDIRRLLRNALNHL